MSEGRKTKKLPTDSTKTSSISGRSSVPLEHSTQSPGQLVSRTLSNEETKSSLPRTETLFEKQRKVFLETSTADIPSPEAAAVLTSIKPPSGTGTSLSSAENITRDRKDSIDSDQRRKAMENKPANSPKAAPHSHTVKEETTIEQGPDGPVEVITVVEEVEDVIPTESVVHTTHPGTSRKVTTTITSSRSEHDGNGHTQGGTETITTIVTGEQVEGEGGLHHQHQHHSTKKHVTHQTEPTEYVTVFETEEIEGDGNTSKQHFSNRGAAVYTTSQHQTESSQAGVATTTTTKKEGLEYLYGGQGVVDTSRSTGAASITVNVPIIHPTPTRQETQYSHLFDPLAPQPADVWNFPPGSKPSNTTPSTSQKLPSPQMMPAPNYEQPQYYINEKERSSKEKLVYASEKSGNKEGGGGGFCSCLFRILCCGPLLCCVVYLAILLGLGLTVYFVWPRAPDVQSLDLVTGPLLINDAGLFGLWKLQAKVKSENYISWTFEQVNVLVYDYVADKQIGNGSMSNADFPGRTNTNFTLPITVNYTTTARNTRDPVVQHFSQCGRGNNSIPLRYKLEFLVKGISWLIKPSVERQTNFTC